MAIPSGGVPDYTYLWNTGDTTQTITSVPEGMYSVTVTDSAGDTATASVVLTAPPEVTVELVFDNCTPPGIMTALPAGGVGGYTYLWNTGANTQSITYVSAGVYAVTVFDANNCGSSTFMKISNDPPSVEVEVTNVPCHGDTTGTLTAIGSGGIPGPQGYQFLWSTGDTGAVVINLPAGTYTVTMTAANGCTATASGTISEPPPLTVVATGTGPTCVGDMNGTVTAFPSGGTPPYMYSWNNMFFGQTINNLGPGTYNVIVTDANGCEATASVTIDYESNLELTAIATDVLCFGTNTGTVTALPVNGVQPYEYLWSNGSDQSTQSNLPVGTYTVTVTDAVGCEKVATVEVGSPPPFMAPVSGVNLSACGSGDGSASVNPAGGVQPYTYLWSTGATTPTISGLQAGTYSVTVTDANDCEAFGEITLTEPPSVDVSIQATPETCDDANDGTATASVQNGTAPYTYAWSNGGNTETITGLAPGTYSVTVVDVNGCTGTATTTIDPAPPYSITGFVTHIDCAEESTGSIEVTPMGGVPGYTYLWSNGQNSSTISNLAAGTYTVTVTDASGCEKIETFVVNEPNDVLTVQITVVPANCFNIFTLAGLASGGTPPYTYNWVGGPNTPIYANLPPGTYTLIVTDANDCVATETITLDPIPPLELTVVGTPPTCAGFADGTATLAIQGGSPPYDILWNNGSTTEAIDNLGAGTYSVTVTDVFGCTAETSITLEEPEVLEVYLAIFDVLCPDSLNGSVISSVVGGTEPYSYLWSNGDTTATLGNIPLGTYILTVTDANGCTATAEAFVGSESQLEVSILNLTPICDIATGGTLQAAAENGIEPYQYLWNTGEDTEVITNLNAGSYSVTVTDELGCTADASIDLAFPDLLTVSLNGTNPSCEGFSDGIITAEVMGGTLPYLYSWNTGANTATISSLFAGTYTLVVTDSQGCEATATITLTEPDLLELSLQVTPSSCPDVPDGSIVSTVTGGTPDYTYLWSNGETTPDLSDLLPGVYELTVTDANGCEAFEMVEVTSSSNLELDAAIISPSCQGANSGSVTVQPFGGVEPYTYLWNNLQTTQSIGNLAPGLYAVTITDANGCVITAIEEVEEAPVPACSIEVVEAVSSAGASDGVLEVSASGGTAPYTFVWNTGDTDPLLSDLPVGIYTVTVSDANGCESTCTIQLGLVPTAKVGDFVWVDANENGIQDPWESGQQGVQVVLTGTDDQGNSVNLSTVTDEEGMYCFDPVPPGTYKITFTLPSGFLFSAPNVGSNPALDSDADPVTGMTPFFTLVAGDADLTWDAGVYQFCVNVDDPGTIGFDEVLCGPGNTPEEIIELTPPVGGVGTLEYLWMQSTVSGNFNPATYTPIPNSNTPNYQPGPLSQTTYFTRCVRREGCILFLEPEPVVKFVDTIAVAAISGPSIVCVDEPETFTAQDNGAGATYLWDFGNGATPATATTPSVSVSWSGFGNRTISLTVTRNGCTSYATKLVSVSNSPILCGPDNNLQLMGKLNAAGKAELEWYAGSVESAFLFSLERSKDGVLFEEVHTQDYEQGVTNYNWLDAHTMPGTNYYRVRLQDKESSYSLLSNTVKLVSDFERTTALVFPNPATDIVYVELPRIYNTEGQIELVNAIGQVVQIQKLPMRQNVITVSLKSLPAGVYYLLVRNGDTLSTHTLLKQ